MNQATSDNFYTANEKFMVVLDSRNATRFLNGSMNSSVTFDFEEPIYVRKNNLQFTCSVMSFTAPNSFYNVTSINNKLNLMYQGVDDATIGGIFGDVFYDVNIIIPSGNYNATTFMAKLKSLVTIVDSGFSAGFGITLDSVTNKFTLTHTSYSFHIMPTSTIYQVMGFDENTEIICTTGIYTSFAVYLPYTCNFNGIQNVNIHFETIVTANLDSYNKSNSPIIQSIPVHPNLAQITYVKTNDYQCTIKQDVIDVIAISIRDDVERLVDFNNQHWNLTLYFTSTKDIDRFSYQQDFRHILVHGYN